MTVSATMTIRLAAETKRKLERLAADTRRSKSYLAAEAVSVYVDRELEIIEGIRRSPMPKPATPFPTTRRWQRSRP